MPRIIITEGAVNGLERCRGFLSLKNLVAARRAAQVIAHYFKLLATDPKIGRPFDDAPELRELLIPFGGSGYTVLYHHDAQGDIVYVLAFRHQKEAGYYIK